MNSKTRFVALTIILIVISCSGSISMAAESTSEISMKLNEISSNIDAGKVEDSISALEKLPTDGMTKEQVSQRHFLLGKAEYIRVTKDIRACREDGIQEKSEIQEHQAGTLRKALESFQQSYETAPDAEWAPEAMFAAGLAQDYGCLNRFEGAIETYKMIIERYPGSPLSMRAQKRYDLLKSSFRKGGHSSDHP